MAATIHPFKGTLARFQMKLLFLIYIYKIDYFRILNDLPKVECKIILEARYRGKKSLHYVNGARGLYLFTNIVK